MDINQFQTPNMSDGEGRRRNASPPSLRRDEESVQNVRPQENTTESSFGEGEWASNEVHPILPQRGDFTEDEMVAARKWITLLRRRLTIVAREAHGHTLGGEEWGECIDEITALSDSIEAVKREFRRN